VVEDGIEHMPVCQVVTRSDIAEKRSKYTTKTQPTG
jgi:hypothetical protein